jgi:hypothetical protein
MNLLQIIIKIDLKLNFVTPQSVKACLGIHNSIDVPPHAVFIRPMGRPFNAI